MLMMHPPSPLFYTYEDDEEIGLQINYEITKRAIREKTPRIEGYMGQIIPSLTALEFKSHFR